MKNVHEARMPQPAGLSGQCLQDSTVDPYVEWLRARQVPLFAGCGILWRLYRNTLIPASLRPLPVQVPQAEGHRLLRKSGALFLRYFSSRSAEPTLFWYVGCPDYDFDRLSGKMRTKIRRAYKDCEVRKLDALWIAEHGYGCYSAAFQRYRHNTPVSAEVFTAEHLDCATGPFEFWGAFVDGKLASYAKCVVGRKFVTMVASKIDPAYASSLPSYALMDTVLRRYVLEGGKHMNNGFRSIDHETNRQEFLLQFGYRREYCDLRIVYRRPMDLLVNVTYPAKRLIDRAPLIGPVKKLRTLLAQEQIRRSFA